MAYLSGSFILSLMNIELLSVGAFEVNCCIAESVNQEALVVDPGADAERIETLLKKRGLRVAAYLLTHGHADHLCALAALQAAFPAPVYLHEKDREWAFGPMNQIPPYYPVPEKPETEPVHAGGKTLSLAGFSVQCIETPGHTPGGVCFYLEDQKVLFSGDTLFKGSCGRTDLPGGNARILSQSLKKTAGLPDETRVYPGHGETTTIGHEKKTNFFLMNH